MNFQERLIMHRKAAGYKTGKDFSASLGISYPSYMAFENKGREPKYDTLCKIADALHVTTDELLGHTVRDSFEYCKNLIESFEFEWMTVEEDADGTICLSDYRGELCHFQSKEEFVNHVLSFEKSFVNDNNYKLYFNLHMYNSMILLSENQQRHNDTLQYIKDSLDDIIDNPSLQTQKQIKEILTNALEALTKKISNNERSTDNE